MPLRLRTLPLPCRHILGIRVLTGSDGYRAAPQAELAAAQSASAGTFSNFVYGIADLENDEAIPRFTVPICPIELGLSHDRGESYHPAPGGQSVRAAGAPLAHVGCHPNLFIFITKKPKDLLQAMENRHFAVSFGNASPAQVDHFIAAPGPVWIWHNVFKGGGGATPLDRGRPVDTPGSRRGRKLLPPTYDSPGAMGVSRLPTGKWSFGPVYVVGDLDRLGVNDLSLGQFADYLAMVSLAKIKTAPHLADAQTILRLFDGPRRVRPQGDERFGQGIPEDPVPPRDIVFVGTLLPSPCGWSANSTPDQIASRRRRGPQWLSCWSPASAIGLLN